MCTVLENASQCHTCVTVFTVLYVSQPCAQFWKMPVSAIRVLLSLQNTHKLNVCIFHCRSRYSAMSVHGQSYAVRSLLTGYLPILLLFVHFLRFFSFLVVQTVKSVYWLESTSINYVIEC